MKISQMLSPMKISRVSPLLSAFLLPALLPLAAPQSARATDYYFDLVAFNYFGSQINLSKSLSYTDSETGQTRYFWFSDADMANPLTSLPDFSDPANNYIFNSNESYSSGTIIIDTDLNAAQIYSSGQDKNFLMQAASSDININIANLRHGTVFNFGFRGANTSVTAGEVPIGGNGITTFGVSGKPIKSFDVTGTFYVSTHSTGTFFSTICANGVENHGIDNPDGKINVLASASSEINKGMLYYGSATTSAHLNSAVNETSYVRINSMKGQSGLLVGGNASSTGKLTVILAATDTFSETSGSIWEGHYAPDTTTYSYKDGGAQLALVMRSSVELEGGGYQYLNNTQSLTGEQIFFTGGVQMISGTLLVNYKAANSGESRSHGNLTLSKAAGAEATTFGNNSLTVGGNFVFTNLEVSDGGGTIRVRLNYNEDNTGLVCDTLTFNGSATGSGTVLIDLSAIGGNPDDYIDFMIENDIELKIISWESAADENITFAATDGYKVHNYKGEDYIFTAKNLADGLYVSYVVVPEPAQWAAMLGFAAIAFAVYKRRRK